MIARELAATAVALSLLTCACTPLATGPGGSPPADAGAADVQDAAVAAPDLTDADGLPDAAPEATDATAATGQPDAPVATDAAPDSKPAQLKLKASHKTLIPPPVPVALSASATAGDVSAGCIWSAGPAAVCEMLPGGKLRKKGDGVCLASCTLADGRCGTISLVAKKQEVLYVVGGNVPLALKKQGSHVIRLRTADGEWDSFVATMPEKRRNLSVVGRNGKLYVAGGLTAGSDDEKEFDPDNFPKCPEAIPAMGGKQFGCLAVRELDLADGKWREVTKLPLNRQRITSAMVGDRWYLLGGEAVSSAVQDSGGFVEVYIDFGAELAVPLVTKYESGCAKPFGDVVVGWGKGLLSFASPKSCQATLDPLMPANVTWAPLNVGWPCTTGAARFAFSLPGALPNIFVLPDSKTGPGCPKVVGKALSGGPIMPPQRYLQGTWSDFGALLFADPPVIAVGPKSVYLLHTEIYFGSSAAMEPVMALDSVTLSANMPETDRAG